ncbi:MAG: hypothetical protein H6Q92_1249, partial [Nitrospirae bacterium]|nr:hypothetical protein [Nitrospirota bacterium]
MDSVGNNKEMQSEMCPLPLVIGDR